MSFFTQEQLFSQARFLSEDYVHIRKCRGEHNRLGFFYQLAFVRLLTVFANFWHGGDQSIHDNVCWYSI